MIKHLTSGLCAVAAAYASVGECATCTWTGNGADNHWSTSANWDNCGGAHAIPVNGDTLVFPAGAARPANNNDLTKLNIAQLQIDSVVSITGNAVAVLQGIVANIPGVAGNASFGPDAVLFSGDQTFSCIGARSLILGGKINLNGNALTVDAAPCDITLSGDVIGAGGITKDGTGFLFLEASGVNTYTGTTTINNGRVRALSGSGLGAVGAGNETIVNAGASLLIGGGHTFDEALTLSGAGFNSVGALSVVSGDNVLSGNVTLAADSAIGIGATSSALTISGAILAETESLTKSGSGTLRLDGVNTYGGVTAIQGGPLEVNGSILGADIVGGRLAGVGISDLITIESGGTLAPGTATGANIGTLDAQHVTWVGGGKMAFELGVDSAHSDRLVAASSFDPGTGSGFEFQFSDGATPPTVGVAYTLVSFSKETFADAGDFSFTYAGTGPGSSMTGTFALASAQLQFTPATVVSDLLFRNGVE